jgi:hypothetical protein
MLVIVLGVAANQAAALGGTTGTCRADNQTCTYSSQCCNKSCTNGLCQPLVSYPPSSAGDVITTQGSLHALVTLNHLKNIDNTSPSLEAYATLESVALRCKNPAGNTQVLNNGRPFNVLVEMSKVIQPVLAPEVDHNGNATLSIDYDDGQLLSELLASQPQVGCKPGWYTDKLVVSTFVVTSVTAQAGVVSDRRQDLATAGVSAKELFNDLDQHSGYTYPTDVICSDWFSTRPCDWVSYCTQKGLSTSTPTPPACCEDPLTHEVSPCKGFTAAVCTN